MTEYSAPKYMDAVIATNVDDVPANGKKALITGITGEFDRAALNLRPVTAHGRDCGLLP